jgi:hypothetical protein
MWGTTIKEKRGWAGRDHHMKWLRSLNRSRIYNFLSEFMIISFITGNRLCATNAID